ncbi:hypothetical protein Trisim1_005179 [Trichoderma cf. simile WF8]
MPKNYALLTAGIVVGAVLIIPVLLIAPPLLAIDKAREIWKCRHCPKSHQQTFLYELQPCGTWRFQPKCKYCGNPVWQGDHLVDKDDAAENVVKENDDEEDTKAAKEGSVVSESTTLTQGTAVVVADKELHKGHDVSV